jgi:CDP-glucose 4,6-dehydratase
MEKLDLDCLFSGFYRNKKILITGHTGFKGGWLTYWLKLMGADIVGLSLPLDAAASNHWKSLSLNGVKEYFFDIRDKEKLNALFLTEKPEIVFHFAAQALVRQSYLDPIETWSTNVLGTAQLLDSARQTPGMRAIVLATTDKCYKNKEWVWGYREIDELGGYDPYSASKAGSELVIASYRDSFFKESGCQLASIRAGNVFGGGDWSDDRLIPMLLGLGSMF